jgi:hypothetical protein
MMIRTLTLFLLCATFFAGCSVMSKDDCLKADWRELGRRDASQGLTIERFAARADACRKNDVGADQRDTARRQLRQLDADEAATRRLIRQAELSALSL